MENKEVWVVVLVLGFVLLMNDNEMTGNYGVRNRERPMVVENRQLSGSLSGSGYYYEPQAVRRVYNRPTSIGALPYNRLDEGNSYSQSGQPGLNVEFPVVNDPNEVRRLPRQGVVTERPYVFPRAKQYP